jgi:hypothetical protein
VSDPVERWAGEGAKDSSGAFSLDGEAARRKLARMNPDLWLGKLVQAAVCGGAREIRFRLGRFGVEARLALSGDLSGRARSCVDMALALAGSLEPGKLTWDGRVFLMQQKPLQQLRALLTGRRNRHLLLYERAYLCPIPVWLDGVLLNAPRRLPSTGCEALRVAQSGGFLAPSLTDLRATSVHLGGQHAAGWNSFGQGTSEQRLLVVEGLPQARLESRDLDRRLPSRDWVSSQDEDEEVVLCSSCLAKGEVNEQWEWRNAGPYLSRMGQPCRFTRVDRWISYSLLPARCIAWPVRDGLLLDPIEIDGPSGCRAIVAADNLKVDLDGMRLVENEALADWRKALLTDLERLRHEWKRGRPLV